MPGGCRFWPDKKLYRRKDCDTKGDIARVIELSSKSNRAVSFSEEDAWVWRDWKGYLSLRFNALKVCFILMKKGIDFNNITLIGN